MNYGYSLKLRTVDFLERLALPDSVKGMAEDWFELAGRRRPREDFPYHYKKILVIQPDLIGDLVLTAPFLRELRAVYPDSWITLVVEPGTFNLVEHCPHVNEVLKYDCKQWKLYWRWKLCLAAAWLSARHLIWRNFDLAIFPHWGVDHYYGSMVAYLSGAMYRIGYSERVTAEKRIVNRNYNVLLTHALEEGAVKHEVEQKLFVIRSLDCQPASDHLELWLTNKDETFAQAFLRAHRYRNSLPLVAICLGGSHARKRWPPERFLHVARWLIDTYDAEILLVGSSADREASEQLKNAGLGSRLIDATSKTTLRQSAALLKHCCLYVGNDTGPMHLAGTDPTARSGNLKSSSRWFYI